MAGQRAHGGEITEWLQCIGVVVQEAGDGPSLAVIGMLARPDLAFTAEPTRTDDMEFFQGIRAKRSATVRQARISAPVTVS